jgi:hypothetical protein
VVHAANTRSLTPQVTGFFFAKARLTVGTVWEVLEFRQSEKGEMIMIGDRIGEENGQVTGTRVLPARNGLPVVEISFQQSGEIYGIRVTDLGTYESVNLPDGRLTGRGHGVLMTPDGDTVSWDGYGMGRFTVGGRVSWRGSLHYHTTSERLDRLNDVVGMFEYEVDEAGKTTGTLWEWK